MKMVHRFTRSVPRFPKAWGEDRFDSVHVVDNAIAAIKHDGPMERL